MVRDEGPTDLEEKKSGSSILAHVKLLLRSMKQSWLRVLMTRGEAGLRTQDSGLNHCLHCSRRTVKTVLCFASVRFLLAANHLWCEILPTVPGPCVILLSWRLDVFILSSVLVKRGKEQAGYSGSLRPECCTSSSCCRDPPPTIKSFHCYFIIVILLL